MNIAPYTDTATVSIPASARIACYSDAPYSVTQILAFPNYPDAEVVLFSGVGAFTSAVFTAATTVQIAGGAFPIEYSVGTAAVVPKTQPTPGALNVTGAVTAALIFGGIVTSTTAAAVAGTVPTGTVMDAAGSFDVDDYVDWTVINTGGANAFTVTAADGHTLVGLAAVAANTSGTFRTRKTAANTFVTYRL